MKVVLLCGGKGTRLREHTQSIPKPLVEIGGKPILWHVMKSYAHFGFDDFVLCLGYKGRMIKEYFDPQRSWKHRDLIVDVTCEGAPRLRVLGEEDEHWQIGFVNTGEATETGGRIKRVERIVDGDTFMVNYADGLADLDVRRLLEFHRARGKIGTLTVVRPLCQWGVLELNDGAVTRFREKPRMNEWVSGGFFVFESRFFDYLDEECVLERGPLERLAGDGQLAAFRHDGFWKCMDTYKDSVTLNELWRGGSAPWKVWLNNDGG